MKNIFPFLALLTILLSCTPAEKQNENDSVGEDVTNKCEKFATFGDIKVCLPDIEGMNECYGRPNVKAKADEFNYQGNSILAYYINDSTFKQVEKIDEITFDDYFQIYVTDELQGRVIGSAELNEMAEMIENNYIGENWDDLKGRLDQDMDYLTIGKPILVENYIPLEDVRTMVMLVKYENVLEEKLVVVIANMMQIKKRLVWTAYYKNYNGEESIKKAKISNDYGVIQIMSENK